MIRVVSNPRNEFADGLLRFSEIDIELDFVIDPHILRQLGFSCSSSQTLFRQSKLDVSPRLAF